MTEVMWLCFCEVGSLAVQKDKEEARKRTCYRDSSWAAAAAPCLREPQQVARSRAPPPTCPRPLAGITAVITVTGVKNALPGQDDFGGVMRRRV